MLRNGGTTATPEDVRSWVQAGLIDASTAELILAFEAERSTERQASSERPSVPELLVYLAAAITAAGFTILAATNWEHLSSAARVLIPAIASAAVLAAGYRLRRAQSGALVRAASLSWLLAGALICATVAILANQAGWSDNDVALAAGVSAVTTGVALWVPMRMHPQVVGIGAAAFLLSTAVSGRAGEDWIVAVLGFSLAMFGLAALIATELAVLVPRSSARLIAGAGLGVGALCAGLPPSPPVTELLSLAAVIVLVAAGIRFQSLVYVAFGVLTAFAGLLKLILRHVDSPTLAGLALIAIGLLLLLAITVLRKTQPWAWRGALPPAQTIRDSSTTSGRSVGSGS